MQPQAEGQHPCSSSFWKKFQFYRKGWQRPCRRPRAMQVPLNGKATQKPFYSCAAQSIVQKKNGALGSSARSVLPCMVISFIHSCVIRSQMQPYINSTYLLIEVTPS